MLDPETAPALRSRAERLLVSGAPRVSLLAVANRDGINCAREPGKAVLHLAVPGGG